VGTVRLEMIRDLRLDGRNTVRSLGGGWWSQAFRCTFDDPSRSVVADLAVTVGTDGHPNVVEVTTRPREGRVEIEPAALRLPLGEIVRAALWIARSSGPVRPPGARPRRGDLIMFDQTLGPSPTVPRRRADESDVPRRRSYMRRTDARMVEVAEIVRQAPKGQRRQRVADHFDVRPNTARNLIREARRRGFLEALEQTEVER
jgi:hypothetical protein